MKKIIKKFLPQAFWSHMIYLKTLIFKRGYFALYGIDKKLEKKYLNYNDGFFVELGANNGFSQSNTLAFERKRNWRGVLIEPSPNLFLECYFYRSKKGNSLHCNACVPFDYNKEYVEINYSNLMSTSESLSSDIPDKEVFKNNANQFLSEGERSLKFGAKAKTLNRILDESNAPLTIDFLSLDVEGAEIDVLAGINFNKYKFKYILIECRDLVRLQEYLKSKEYYLIDKLSHHDYLFCQNKN